MFPSPRTEWASVEATSGTAKAFVCRYHAWTYDLGGALGHVPMAHCFGDLDKASSGLVSLPCEIRHGFVWVTLTPDATIDIGAFLGEQVGDGAADAPRRPGDHRRLALQAQVHLPLPLCPCPTLVARRAVDAKALLTPRRSRCSISSTPGSTPNSPPSTWRA